MKRLNVGVDLDGVTYEFHRAFGPLLLRHGIVEELPTPTNWNFFEDFGLNREQFHDVMGKFVTAGELFWHGPEVAGAREGLAALAERGHRIVFVTERAIAGYELIMRRATYYWLAMNGMPHDALIIGPKIGLGLDVMLDDAPHVIAGMRGERTLGVYYDQPWNHADDDAARVTSWAEFIVLCDELAGGRPSDEVQAAWSGFDSLTTT